MGTASDFDEQTLNCTLERAEIGWLSPLHRETSARNAER
jgi:hypothetical protein